MGRQAHDPSLRDWALRWMASLLVVAGGALLVWCALLVIDANISQRLARDRLTTESRDAASDSRGRSGSAGRFATPLHMTSIARGSPVAELSIPRVHLSAVVLHGSDARTLRRGPGHLENTALPGEAGNAVIAGHRDTFFRPLRDVQKGDDIFADTPQGRFHYRVTSVRVVTPRDVDVLAATDKATLTLITCYPFWVLGPAPDRLVVRAVGVDSTTGAFVTPAPRPREPIPAAVARHAPAKATGSVNSTTARSDDALVRQAIEQFRLTYNARLANHPEEVPGGALTFHDCAVAVTGEQAAATCNAFPGGSPNVDRDAWTLTLDRSGGSWAIRSVVHK